MKSMKRRDVERLLATHGCTIIREGGEHTLYGCPCGQHRAPLPRHSEISPGVVRDVQKKLSCLPDGWLQ